MESRPFPCISYHLWEQSLVLVTLIAEYGRNFCSNLWFLASISNWSLPIHRECCEFEENVTKKNSKS
jgi:hypothetical protein